MNLKKKYKKRRRDGGTEGRREGQGRAGSGRAGQGREGKGDGELYVCIVRWIRTTVSKWH